MKITLTSLFILICVNLFGQDNALKTNLSFAYMGQYAFEPGVKIGSQFNMQNLPSEKAINYNLFISPQASVFTRAGKNTNFFLNLESGVRKQKENKKMYSSLGVSLGYLLQNELLSFSVDLATGDKTDKVREQYHAFLPMLNYEFGKNVSAKLAWYLKLSAGHKLYFNRTNELTFFLEAGTRFTLKPNETTNSND